MRSSRLLLTGAVLFAGACAPPLRYIPPKDPIARNAEPVAAPFDRAWDAVIDLFAREVIPIETLDRASGFVAASSSVIRTVLPTDSTLARALADCGRLRGGYMPKDLVYPPESARYNVLVRSTGPQSSTVRVTAAFFGGYWAAPYHFTRLECSSTGDFESRFEKAVKEAAERR